MQVYGIYGILRDHPFQHVPTFQLLTNIVQLFHQHCHHFSIPSLSNRSNGFQYHPTISSADLTYYHIPKCPCEFFRHGSTTNLRMLHRPLLRSSMSRPGRTTAVASSNAGGRKTSITSANSASDFSGAFCINFFATPKSNSLSYLILLEIVRPYIILRIQSM